MSSYWDNQMVRVALPAPYTRQHKPGENRARYLGDLVQSLEHQKRAIDDQLELLRPMLAEAEGRICMRCYGSGKIHYLIAQDESRVDTCSECGGTGEPRADQQGIGE